MCVCVCVKGGGGVGVLNLSNAMNDWQGFMILHVCVGGGGGGGGGP